jgi:uncharacterized integral membrane protein
MTEENPSPTTRIGTPGSGDPGSEAAPVVDGSSAPATDAHAASARTANAPAGPQPPVDGPTGSGWLPPSPRPTRRDRDRGRDAGGTASLVLGIVLLAIGLWFFAQDTLGLELPSLRWNQLWPIILIVIGAWVLMGAVRRGPR